jgi:predicted ATP-grasp superfamily ATP-dependent carboligase
MDAEKRLIVTGGGGVAGVNFIHSLRLPNASKKYFIVATDTNKYHLELPMADQRILGLRCDDEKYLEYMNCLVDRFKIEMIHPQPDVEVRAISELRDKLDAMTFLPSQKAIRILQDKAESAKIWANHHIPVAKTYEIVGNKWANMLSSINEMGVKLGYPYWMRATTGAGGRGSTPVPNEETAIGWLMYWRGRGENWKFIAQEMLDGKNLAWTSLWKNGELVVSQCRERLQYIYPYLAPSGITGTPTVAVTVDRPDVDRVAQECVLAVDKKPQGIYCVDLKENSKKVPCVTEINSGRFFTTSRFYSEAGVNFPDIYVNLAFDEKIPKVRKTNAVGAGVYYIRHMDSKNRLVRDEQWHSKKYEELCNSNVDWKVDRRRT